LPEITLRATPPPERTIIDMRAERQIKNFDFLSEAAKTIITESTAPVLLYLNQHGSETLLTCQHCRWLAPCPVCDKALTFNKQTQQLECRACGHQQSPIPRCLSCGSDRLKLSASGQKKLQKEIAKLFPDKKIILHSSGDSSTELKDNTVVIATSAILSTLHRFRQTIMVSADNELQRPDFQAADQLRRTIFKLQQLSDNLLIQTFNPEHYLFATLNSYGAFYQEELKFRADFGYPPTQPSYKLIFRSAKKSSVKDQPTVATVVAFLKAEGLTARNYLTYDKHIILRGLIDAALIDKLHKKFNNKLIIEINPYQWL
jgi:primosomal protein N' (replication factor Y)